MSLPPIITALKKHKAGVMLITLQIALTLAIVCNAVFVIGQRVSQVDRPTGVNAMDLFWVGQMYVNAPKGHNPAAVEKLDAMQRADLATLRALPDVESATSISTLPLHNAQERAAGVGVKPDQKSSTAGAWLYYTGSQALKTLGLQLTEGRNFTPVEVTHQWMGGSGATPLAIVTRELAHDLFPHDSALGKTIYLNGGTTPTTVIGVVARLEGPESGLTKGSGFALNSILLPVRLDSFLTSMAVRSKPGRLTAAMREARNALLAANPMRVLTSGIPGLAGILPYSKIRARANRADVGLAILMGIISVILLAVTGAGVVGLTSFWVGQRRKQIGIRRALGATRRDILRYFQLENLFIAGIGVVLGAILAIGLNLWLMKQFQMERMPLVYVLVGVVVLLLIGQGAVFAPALRASRVSPAEATRSV